MTKTLDIKNPLSCPSSPPQFYVKVKNNKGDELLAADPKATRALIACMDMEASLRGAASHWGGPSAFAEIMSSLHALIFKAAKDARQNWYDMFHLINDAGHCENALYAIKANYQMAGLNLEELKGFRSLKSRLTGHGEAHLFPEGVYLSNGPLGSTLAQAQGLSLADKLQNKNRLCIVTLSDGAFMEGEVKESISSLAGLASKNQLNPFLLIISDNNTKLSGRIDKDSFSLEPSLSSLAPLGWELIKLQEGNHLQKTLLSLESSIDKAWSSQKPVCLWVKTKKGYGVKSTEEASSGGHGFPLKKADELLDFIKEIYSSTKIPKEILNWCEQIQKTKIISQTPPTGGVKIEKAQKGISKALIKQKQNGLPIVSISSDLQGSTGLGEFRKSFPESSFDIGVAEANMISVAAGFSKQGFIPIVDTFAQFGVTKGSLPLIMSALSQAPVIGIFSHIGFQDAADGASHQSLAYLAQTCALPNTEVFCLSCSGEAEALLTQTLDNFAKTRSQNLTTPSSLFFLGREVFPQHLTDNHEYSLKKAQVVFKNIKGSKPVCIVSAGPLLTEALACSQELAQQGRGVVLINSPCINSPDIQTIATELQACEGRLLTLEEHQIEGGLASQLVLKLKQSGAKIQNMKNLAVQDRAIGRSAYSSKELYKLFNLDKEACLQACRDLN